MAGEEEIENSIGALEAGAEPESLEEQNADVRKDNSSLVYYIPSYSTYPAWQSMASEGQSLGQQSYSYSAGYLQESVSHGSESKPFHSWDSNPSVGDSQKLPKRFDFSNKNASASRPAASSNAKVPNSVETAVTVDVKASANLSDSKSHQHNAISDLSSRPIKMLNKVSQMSSGILPNHGANGYCHSANNIFSFSDQGQGGFFAGNNPRGSRLTYGTVNCNDHFQMREKCNLNQNYEPSSELVRGPRADKPRNASRLSEEKASLNPFIRRDKYNKSDFETKHGHARFFMIKSYSEDDVHKSIKYNVWASTANGNKKLDAAFRDAEMEMNERGIKCPIFLFFSVNASGQFVGLAEMIGPVDFKKTMDFWQQDKWNGFFPVAWHIIKDIPNRHFEYITLENNDNKPVTFSRDTQEIRLPQGLRMLLMFKNYPLRTSILDDFDFYENREKSLHSTRRSKPSGAHSKNHLEVAFRNMSMSAIHRRPHHGPQSSPDNIARNTSRNIRPLENRR